VALASPWGRTVDARFLVPEADACLAPVQWRLSNVSALRAFPDLRRAGASVGCSSAATASMTSSSGSWVDD
jgi:hypothetical protein